MSAKRRRKLSAPLMMLAASSLLMSTTSCATFSATEPVAGAEGYCAVAESIYPSRNDTDGTKAQVLREWRKGEALCHWQPPVHQPAPKPATFVADEAQEPAKPQCAPYADAGRNLTEAGFAPVFGGVIGGGRLLVVFMNNKTGDWLVLTVDGHNACVAVAGNGAFAPKPADTSKSV